MILTFDVPGPPVPKARARTTSRGSYTPQRTLDYEKRVACAARLALVALGESWDQSLSYALNVIVVPYQSAAQQRKGDDERRGDWDNYGKIVSDALNGVLWLDDKQVTYGHVTVCMPSVRPGVRVTVEAMQRPPSPVTNWPVCVALKRIRAPASAASRATRNRSSSSTR